MQRWIDRVAGFLEKSMPRRRSHSVEFKRQVAQQLLDGETLHGLIKR